MSVEESKPCAEFDAHSNSATSHNSRSIDDDDRVRSPTKFD